ncbi:MAG: cell wall hydrolase [Rhizomicrobium sp.]|jgi:hypothetical protein
MKRQFGNALRRADRALAITLLLVVSFTAGVLFGSNAPASEQVASTATVAPAAQQQPSQIAHAVQRAAGATPSLRPYSFGADSAMTPASVTSNDVASIRPLDAVFSPVPASELALVRILQDQKCLAEAMYYEARGEGREGQEAIAEVVFHRMKARGYPRSICGVVYQGSERGHGCQFSFACDGELQLPKSPSAWSRARLLAAKIMAGAVQLGDITGDAISFHAADIQPDWADTMERTIQIGNHVFYRSLPRTKSS